MLLNVVDVYRSKIFVDFRGTSEQGINTGMKWQRFVYIGEADDKA